jgi:hypothetical protein
MVVITGRASRKTVCVFITAVPIINLFAWGEGDSGKLLLRMLNNIGYIILNRRFGLMSNLIPPYTFQREDGIEATIIVTTTVLQGTMSTLRCYLA